MKSIDRANNSPQIGHSTERLIEDRKLKQSQRVQAGSCLCERCGAVSYEKHWFFDRVAATRVAHDPTSRVVVCPGCQRIEKKMIEGEVFLESPLLAQNHEMVYGTIYHTADRGFLDNPLSRVATIEDSGDSIRILTTTRTLANRIAKAFKKAFKGELDIESSPGDRLVRLYWHR